MEFTSKQLQAIENSICFPTTVTVRTGSNDRFEQHYGGPGRTELEITATVHGQQVHTRQTMDDYRMSNVPFRVIAERAVMDINHYIMKGQFAKGGFNR